MQAVRFLNVHRVVGRGVFAPNIDMMPLAQADLKRSVRFDRPNRAERVRPGSNQCRFALFLEHRATRKHRETDDNQSQGDLLLHGIDAVQIAACFQERMTGVSLLIGDGV